MASWVTNLGKKVREFFHEEIEEKLKVFERSNGIERGICTLSPPPFPQSIPYCTYKYMNRYGSGPFFS